MNMVGVESVPFIVGALIALLYSYLIRNYNIKRRKYEEFLFALLVFLLLTPLFIVLYSIYTYNFNFSYIFHYTYSGMNRFQVFISTLYSFPVAYILALMSVLLVFIRFKYIGLNRSTSRKTYISYPLFISVILIVFSFFPPYTYFNNNVTGGQGPYPYFMDALSIASLLLIYIAILTGFIGSAYYITGWIHRESNLEKFSRIMIYIMGLASSSAFLLRLYFLHEHYIQNGFFSWNIITFSTCLLVIMSLLYFEILKIRRNRILGSLAYTSYVTLVIALVLITILNPENMGISNHINFYEYFLILILASLAGLAASGTEVFKRFFLPWDDDSIEFLERFPSIMIYTVVTLIGLFLFLNLSIYTTIGGLNVTISKYYHYYILLAFGVSPLTSLVSGIIAKIKNRLSWVSIFSILILFVLYGVVFLREGLEIILYTMIVGYILSIPLLVYVKRFKGFPLSRVLLITILALFLVSQSTYGKGPVKSLAKGETYQVDNIASFNLTQVSKGSSDIKIYKSINGNTTALYDFEKAVLNNNIVLEKLYYPVKEFVYYNNYRINTLTSSYFICLNNIPPKGESANIYYIKMSWPIYQYLALLIILFLSILLTGNDRLY